MGIADAIIDLVSSGTTLRENNLKEIDDGTCLESQVNCNPYSCIRISVKLFIRVLQGHHFFMQSCFWNRTWLLVFCFCLYKTICWVNVLQAVLVASKKSLIEQKGVLEILREILERFDAHLRAISQFTVYCWSLVHSFLLCFLFTPSGWQVVANMRGSSAEEVAERVLSQPSLSGLQVTCWAKIQCYFEIS